MNHDPFILKIEIMPDASRVRYMQASGGSVFDTLVLPLTKEKAATHITCKNYPGDTRTEVSRSTAANLVRSWRKTCMDVVIVDHRCAIQEVTMPSGIVLSPESNILLLTKAFQQWQRGELVLAQDDAMALKIWIGNRVPFGTAAVEAIKDMSVLEGLEDV